MASFDIVSKTDMQKVDNAVQVSKKEIQNRWDLKNSECSIELNKQNKSIHIQVENDMQLNNVIDILHSRLIKQGVDPRALDESKPHYASGKFIKKDITIREGIEKEKSKEIIEKIKSLKLKATTQYMDQQIRVTSKSIDELQRIIGFLKTQDIGIPLDFQNFKR
ncbi:MAG: YajQ family cyclic di-GMP-binding protein [Bacteroidia bacterium]|nr:YajQ family cyclic di-GMP-binding protein [Bacteroidia bacterium]